MVKQAQKKTAVIYARFSCHAQKEESIEQQVEVCTEYASANGIEIVDIYSDKAITGKKETRAAYQRMLRDAERRKFTTIIAYKSNRMARNMLNALQLEDRMAAYGVSILYAREEFGDNPTGRFALRMMMNVNQFYSENLAEDITRGMRDNAKSCKVNNGILPLGYCKGADGRYEIVDSEAEIVREVFTKFIEDVPLIDIANEMNARGVKTKTGGRWNKNSFSKMLSNERYIGVYLWSDIRIEDGIPKIIDKELFYAVQEKLKTKSNPRGRHQETGDYLLTGKLFCGKCESIMAGMSGTSGTGAKHYYYACQRSRAGACDKKAVRRDDLELHVAEAVREFVLRDDIVEWMADCCMDFQKHTFESQQAVALQKQKAEVESAIKNIVDAIAHGIYTDSTKARLLELEAEKKSLEQSICEQSYSMKPMERAEIIYYIESFRNGDVTSKAYQKRLFDQFVSSIYLYDNELRISFSGSRTTQTIPFSIVDHAEELADSEVRLNSAMLHQRSAKRTFQATVYAVGKDFVLVTNL